MTDAKSRLNNFCQRKAGKTIGKEDVMYSNQKFDNQFQSTVTIVCLGGVQFAGMLGKTAKEAEQNAASAALAHYADEINSMPQPQGKKRKADSVPGIPATPGIPGPVTNKSLLNGALGRILKRPLTKDDILCQNVSTGNGFQCTLSLPGMPGEWGSQAWAGEVAGTHKVAEESAASYAFAALQSDPLYGPVILAPKSAAPKKPYGKGGGGFGGGMGKGGGKGFGGGKGKGSFGGAGAFGGAIYQQMQAGSLGIGFQPTIAGFSGSGFSPL